MRAIITLMVAFALAASSAFAVNINVQCQNAGFDFGIVKFEYESGVWTPEEAPVSPYVVTVSGDDDSADWTSMPAAAGLIHKEANNLFSHVGGTAGTVDKVSHGLSYILFCGNDDTPAVPEFTTIGAGAVLAGAAGLSLWKRRK